MDALKRSGLIAKVKTKGTVVTIGDKKVVSFVLLMNKNEVKGTAWNADADKWDNALDVGMVYVFKQFLVKMQGNNYNWVGGEEILFTKYTTAAATYDYEIIDISPEQWQLIALNQVKEFAGKAIQVAGLTVEDPVINGNRQTITIADKTKTAYKATLWNVCDGSSITKGTVLVLRGCHVKNFGGGLELSVLPEAQIVIDPGKRGRHVILSHLYALQKVHDKEYTLMSQNSECDPVPATAETLENTEAGTFAMHQQEVYSSKASFYTACLKCKKSKEGASQCQCNAGSAPVLRIWITFLDPTGSFTATAFDNVALAMSTSVEPRDIEKDITSKCFDVTVRKKKKDIGHNCVIVKLGISNEQKEKCLEMLDT